MELTTANPRLRHSALQLVVVCALTALPVGAQQASGWGIAAQRVVVDLTAADGSADVTVAWLLAGADPDMPLPADESVPLALLGFGEADVEDVVRDGAETIVLWPTSGSRRTATVRPPFDSEGGSLLMKFTYRVASAVEIDGERARARVPLLTGPPLLAGNSSVVAPEIVAAAGLGPAGFSAEVRVPEEWVVADGFPSGLRPSSAGVYEVELPTTPAMIGFRARTDGRWVPGVPLLIDTVTVALLLAFAAFGWRHLQGVVSGRATGTEPTKGASP